MACAQPTAPAPDSVVVAFTGRRPKRVSHLKDQRPDWSDLPANVKLHPNTAAAFARPPRLRLADTPERAVIRALGRVLTPKAFTGLTQRLRDQAEAGDLCSKAGLLMVMDQA